MPDLVVLFKNANGARKAKFVLEVGFSETYEDLVEDVKMWLEGRRREVSTIVLVKFEESPAYRCPALPRPSFYFPVPEANRQA